PRGAGLVHSGHRLRWRRVHTPRLRRDIGHILRHRIRAVASDGSGIGVRATETCQVMSLFWEVSQPPPNDSAVQPRKINADVHHVIAPGAPASQWTPDSAVSETDVVFDRKISAATAPVSPLIDPFGRIPIIHGRSFRNASANPFSTSRKYSTNVTTVPAVLRISAPIPMPNKVISTQERTPTPAIASQPDASGSRLLSTEMARPILTPVTVTTP